MNTRLSTDDALAADWHQLLRRYHRTMCQMDRVLEAAHGITASDFEVLQQLHAAGGDCSLKMNDLGENVHLSQSALSRLVARLENDGLLTRTMCTQDRRSVFAAITPKGRRVFEEARPTQRAVLRDYVSESTASARANRGSAAARTG